MWVGLADLGRAVGTWRSTSNRNPHNRLQDLFNANLIVRIEQGSRVYYELA